MKRRDFLKIGALVTAATPFLKLEAKDAAFEMTADNTSMAMGYDIRGNMTWSRISVILSDGSEWHDVVERAGGDYTNDPKALEIFSKMHEMIINRELLVQRLPNGNIPVRTI